MAERMNTIKLNSWRPKTSQEKLAIEIINLFHKAGFRHTYIVGGYVRDLLLKRPETGAIDIATIATPQQAIKLLEKQKYNVIPTGLKHGTITVHHKSDDIEITTFRKEGKYGDSRRPDKVVFVSDPAIDATRRDFTINAFYFDPAKLEIYDFVDGSIDLKKRRLRFIGSAIKRISEDSLRLMRAARFVTILGFKLDLEAKKAIAKNASKIKKVSPERIKQELDKLFLSKNRSEGIKLLLDLGLLKQILPEVDRLNKTPQSKNYHSEGNVFVHTLLALSQIEDSAKLSTIYGLLFHDLGKAVTRRLIQRNGKPHTTFYNHQNKGVEIARGIFKRLRFSNKEAEDIGWLIKNHHVPYEINKMRKGKQTAWALDPRFGELLKLFLADSQASIPSDSRGRKLAPDISSYKYATRLYQKAQSRADFKKPLVTGHDVMKVLHLKPGPDVGKILAKVRELQLESKLKNRNEAYRWLRSQRS